MKKRPKGRPRKPLYQQLQRLDVRVPHDVKQIVLGWGKLKGERIAELIRAAKDADWYRP